MCGVQAAKVHAAMLYREEHGSEGARMAALHKSMLPLVERAVRVFEQAKHVFYQAPDLRFDGWAAVCATQSASGAAQWALMRVDTSKVKGQRVSAPPSIHLVHLQVWCWSPTTACCVATRVWRFFRVLSSIAGFHAGCFRRG